MTSREVIDGINSLASLLCSSPISLIMTEEEKREVLKKIFVLTNFIA